MIKLDQFSRVLTFFAHPDDETLAAGATLSKLSRLGVDIHVAIPATGIHSRRNTQNQTSRDSDLMELREDCRKAMRVLGKGGADQNIYLGEFPDNEMDKHSLLELIQWLEGLINKINPDILITHHRYCTNIDHQYCHEAAVVATRPDLNRHIPISYAVKSQAALAIFDLFNGNLISILKSQRKTWNVKSKRWEHIKVRQGPILIRDQGKY